MSLKMIPLADIRENAVALRNVTRETESYQGLVDSIRGRGVLNAINVREKHDPATGVAYYELVDGLHRFSAAKDAGLSEIPAQILKLEDAEVLEAQIIANVQRVETRPVEYSQQLRRILAANPMMTESELAHKLSKSPAWIQQRLGLNKISNEKVKTLIDEGKIVLSNAYALAKLDEGDQVEFLDRAQIDPPDVFVGAVNARAKEVREAKRQGKDPAKAEFQPVAHMQRLVDVKDAMADSSIAQEVISATGASNSLEGFMAALQWVLNLDPTSVAAQRAKWEAQRAAREEAKAARNAEREAKKMAEAAASSAEAEE